MLMQIMDKICPYINIVYVQLFIYLKNPSGKTWIINEEAPAL